LVVETHGYRGLAVHIQSVGSSVIVGSAGRQGIFIVERHYGVPVPGGNGGATVPMASQLSRASCTYFLGFQTIC
jgi:hypothetical protein